MPRTTTGRSQKCVVDGHELTLSNVDKPYWPDDGITKGDLLAFYSRIAPFILPHLRDRPVSMWRHPHGAPDPGFFQKQVPEHAPTWIRTVPLPAGGRVIDFVVCDDRATLLWLVNLGCIDQHPWHSHVPTVEEPDYVLFDLDPFAPAGLREAIQVGLLLKEALDVLGLASYPKISGATGFHVYVPLRRGYSYEVVRHFAGVVGRKLMRQNPRLITMEWAIANRTGKVFFDHNMNSQGKTVASVYSARPHPKAPVSVPLRWDEVHVDLDPTTWTIHTVFERLDEVGDLFAPVLKRQQALEPAIARLQDLL